MSTDRETTRIVRSWLEDGTTRLPESVLDAVLAELPTTPQRRATWWPARRTSTMNKLVAIGLGAAAVIVTLLIGARLFGSPTANVGGPNVEPTPSASGSAAEPTDTPQPSVAEPSAEAADLDEGPYVLLRGISDRPDITVTIPAAGWSANWSGGILFRSDGAADPPDGAGLIVFPEGGDWYVPSDPCRWSRSVPEIPATTVAELASALAAQESREASAPVDVTIDGYTGVSLTMSVPDDAVFPNCDGAQFCTLARDPGARSGGCWRYNQGPGQIDKLWIVDVNGVPIIIDAAWYEGTPSEHVAELEAIVSSVTFE